MDIYIDESGSFVNAPRYGAWNVVVAYASPEGDRRQLRECLRRLKISSGHSVHDEVKLANLEEELYLRLLETLAGFAGAAFCTATDAGRNTDPTVEAHQREQVKLVLQHIDKIKYKGGRDGVRLLASQLEALSPQLYVQLHCQIDLIFDVVFRAVMYFVQRRPQCLRRFHWRVDQKNSTKTDYEDAFEKAAPAIIQTRSLTEPMIFVKEFDYSSMSELMYDEAPEYLARDYGIEVGHGLDIGKVIRDDMEFVDSGRCPGVQVADLLASGVRRCLRGGFSDNLAVAKALGSLMIQGMNDRPPVNLIGFSPDAPVDSETKKVVQVMTLAARPMFA